MTRSNSYRTHRRRADFCPRLETLEDRTAPAVFTVANTADGGKESLRYAVLKANANAGPDTIRFDPAAFATHETIRMTGGPITITDPVTIEGPAAGLTLDAGGLSGHFTLAMTHALDPVSMSNLTLTRGGSDYGHASLVNMNASLTLSRMVITNSLSGGISVGFVPSDWQTPWYYSSSAKLLLTDSTVSGNSAGGINIDYGAADISRSIISRNSGDDGGIRVGRGYVFRFGGLGDFSGFSAFSGSLTLTDSTVDENTSTYSGGGIQVRLGQATVVQSTVTGNVAGFLGGDVVGRGGGIFVEDGTVTIARSTISGNAADVGGGIHVGGYLRIGGDHNDALTMEESTVSRNEATTAGGGVSMRDADAVIRNCTISGNVAGAAATSARGGGLAVSDFSSLNLQNSTVAFNSAGRGSGGGIDNDRSRIDLRNVILSNNTAQTAGLDLSGEANVDYSLISSTSGALINGFNNLLNIDARLGPLADNGGPTRTHWPGPGSPVRNAGVDTPGLAGDQRGVGFARVLQGRPDMGSLESIDPFPIAVATTPAVTAAGGTVYVILVTYSDDNAIQASSLGTGDLHVYGRYGYYFSVTPTFVWADVNTNGTPRLATYVFTPPGGAWGPEDNGVYTIYVDQNQVFDTDATPRSVPDGRIGTFVVQIPATYVVDDLSDVVDTNTSPGHLSLREAIVLSGLYPGTHDTITFSPAVFNAPTTIALTGGELKVTSPVSIIGPSAGLTLDASGKSRLFEIDMVRPGEPVSISGLTLTNGSADTGGGVRDIDATLTLSRMVVTKNVASKGGGGIAVSGGSLTVADSTVSGNTGGGIYSVDASVSITGSTISGNATAESGGGVFVSGRGSLSLTDSTVSGNTAASGNGGGLFLAYTTTAVIRNSTIAYNTAFRQGGIYCTTATLESTIVAKNSGSWAADLSAYVVATFSLIGDPTGVTLGRGSGNNLFNRDPQLGPLADNGGPTLTHALLPGSPAINAGSNPANLTTDQRGAGFPRFYESAADIGAFEVQQPTVQSVVVNAGQANLLQRSMVTSLTVTFSSRVTFVGSPAAAFQLSRTGPGGPLGNVTLAVDLTGSTSTQTVARLTFTGPLTEGPNSLIDGNYTLTILSSQVNGGLLGGDSITIFSRLFGDLNGDKTVNLLDLAEFRNAIRNAFGTLAADANYRSDLDFNGDGAINVSDLVAFRTRFGVVLP
jgi:hypothetical protein